VRNAGGTQTFCSLNLKCSSCIFPYIFYSQPFMGWQKMK